MDTRDEAHLEMQEDSSESDERMSPNICANEEDDDKNINSKKRKRGSYRCSRCGMPKRGHNCPDSFDIGHYLSNESSSAAAPAHSVPTSPPYAHPALPVADDPNHEAVFRRLNTLHDENVLLRQEVIRLQEYIQHQQALSNLHSVAEHARSLHPPNVVSPPHHIRAGSVNLSIPPGPAGGNSFLPRPPYPLMCPPTHSLPPAVQTPHHHPHPNSQLGPNAPSVLPMPFHPHHHSGNHANVPPFGELLQPQQQQQQHMNSQSSPMFTTHHGLQHQQYIESPSIPGSSSLKDEIEFKPEDHSHSSIFNDVSLPPAKRMALPLKPEDAFPTFVNPSTNSAVDSPQHHFQRHGSNNDPPPDSRSITYFLLDPPRNLDSVDDGSTSSEYSRDRMDSLELDNPSILNLALAFDQTPALIY